MYHKICTTSRYVLSQNIGGDKVPLSKSWGAGPDSRGGATGAIAPGPPLQGGPRDDIYLFSIKYSFEKLS